MSGTTDSVHGKENLLAAQKAAGKQTGKPDITFTAHGDVARDVLERLQDEAATEEGRKQGRYRLEKQSSVQAHRFRACERISGGKNITVKNIIVIPDIISR